MLRTMRTPTWSTFLPLILLCLSVLVAGCGGASAGSATTNGASIPASMHQQSNTFQQAKTSHQAKNPSSTFTGPLYLIKSLNITMEFKNTQQVATDIQSWISTTDPLATADNINYQQQGDSLYTITMSFSIQASLYPRIESYLNNYPAQHHGQLISTVRNTQDVTGDYIDTQSRVKNLKAEQDRLLSLVSHATALSDILAIDQRLTDVEGQIEQIEAHLNDLTGQTSFSTITINLQPPQTLVTPPPAAWGPGQIWQGAGGAAIVFAQVLATIIIWLLVFSIYIVPAVFVIWGIRRWQRWRTQRVMPAMMASSPLSQSQPQPLMK